VASEFPGSPLLLKGALVSYQTPVLGALPSVIVFQYNPEQLSRSLRARTASYEERERFDRSAVDDAFIVSGPPTESIDLSIEIDATDQLESSNRLAVLRGVQPALAALELLMYPPSAQVLLNRNLAKTTGHFNVERMPLVLFVWGAARVLPVRLTSFNVTEQAFDTMLNPILARVDLGLEVVTYKDVGTDNLANGVHLAMMIQREVLAGLNLFNRPEILGLLPI
jgi:hypothetical protein